MIPAELPLTPEERALLERAAAWPGCASPDLCVEALQPIARTEGIDFATALLYDRLRRSEQHGPLFALSRRGTERVEARGAYATPLADAEVTVAVVPGAFYLEHPESGADGAFVLEQAQRIGCRTTRVPLLSFGPLRDNARLLNDWLARQPDEPILLVSLSKSGAEVRLALAEPGAADLFRKVVAWVNVSGLVRGTAIVSWLFRHRLRALMVRLLCWWRGWAYGALRELERGSAGFPGGEFRVPEWLTVVHLFGFPLTRHLSRPLARRGHRRLAPLGPNDGGANLLGDLTGLPGLIYPVWGADHYLQPTEDTGALFRRLFRYVIEERKVYS